MKGKLIKLYFPLIGLICLAIVFRLYHFSRGFSFAHDQDLYSWIAKDIVVGHHQRLIGQLTSVEGIYIGSFYYYVMALFYAIFGMNPLSAAIPLTLLAIFDIISVFLIFRKHFGGKCAWIGSILMSFSMGIAYFDRWSVPTLPTLAWAIWFLATIIEAYKGNMKYLPIYGLLTALTWQIHIALLPILPLPVLAYIFGRNKINYLWRKENMAWVGVAIAIFLLVISPLIIFEIKHNFSQITSIAKGLNLDAGGPTGIEKLVKVIDASGRELQQRLLFGENRFNPVIYWLAFAFAAIFAVAKRTIDKKLTVVLFLWIGLILLAQFRSKRIVSEYYFTNLVPPVILIISLVLGKLRLGWLYIAGAVYLAVNIYWLVTMTDIDHSYYYRKEVVDAIRDDAELKGYDCVAINYIADAGVGVGFRYLFWYEGIKLVKAGSEGVPIYNIVIPWQVSEDEVWKHFGRFGIIRPGDTVMDESACDKEEYQLDPLLGYTE